VGRNAQIDIRWGMGDPERKVTGTNREVEAVVAASFAARTGVDGQARLLDQKGCCEDRDRCSA